MQEDEKRLNTLDGAGLKTIIEVIAKGSWLTDLEVATRARMKLDAALYYLRRLRRLGLVISEWVHGQRVWGVTLCRT